MSPAPEKHPEKRTSIVQNPAPLAVQVIDKLGEIVAIVALACLCSQGKLGGELTAGAILLVLGVQGGLRSLGGRSTGAVGLGILALGSGLTLAAKFGSPFIVPPQ